MTGATQILFHSITREKLKSVAPDIFIRPEVGAFGALDYFRIEEIFRAAEPAKQLLKNKISQMVMDRELIFPQKICCNARNFPHVCHIACATRAPVNLLFTVTSGAGWRGQSVKASA